MIKVNDKVLFKKKKTINIFKINEVNRNMVTKMLMLWSGVNNLKGKLIRKIMIGNINHKTNNSSDFSHQQVVLIVWDVMESVS